MGISSDLSPCFRELMCGGNQYKDKNELPP